MKYTCVIGIVLFVVLGVAVLIYGYQSHKQGGEAYASTDTVPDVVLTDEVGAPVVLHDVLERPAVINTWASWCPFCVEEIPDFARFAATSQGDIDVVLVNRGESREKGTAFLAGLGVTNSALSVLYDERELFYQGIGGFSMPETVFVDTDGTIRFHKRGPLSFDELEQISSDIGWK